MVGNKLEPQIRIDTCSHALTQTQVRIQTHTYTHVHILTITHKLTHTHTHTHTQTHVHKLAEPSQQWPQSWGTGGPAAAPGSASKQAGIGGMSSSQLRHQHALQQQQVCGVWADGWVCLFVWGVCGCGGVGVGVGVCACELDCMGVCLRVSVCLFVLWGIRWLGEGRGGHVPQRAHAKSKSIHCKGLSGLGLDMHFLVMVCSGCPECTNKASRP